MAYIRKIDSGWRVEVSKKVAGKTVRKSSVFPTKGEATAWANITEEELRRGRIGAIRGKTVGDLMTRYAEEVSINKEGGRWEILRIKALSRDDLWNVPLDVVSKVDIAEWRDRRLKAVSPGAVLRDWTLYRNCFNTAITDWEWLSVNPMTDVKRPPPPPSRDQTWKDDQVDRMLVALGYKPGVAATVGQQVAVAFLLSLETAMRAGEVLAVTKSDVKGKVLSVREGKTEAARRQVPLSEQAKELLSQVGYEFQIDSRQLDSNFRKAKKLAGVEDVTFHDARATAITRLAKKMDILDLARMVGHKNLNQLMTYYRKSVEEIATGLN